VRHLGAKHVTEMPPSCGVAHIDECPHPTVPKRQYRGGVGVRGGRDERHCGDPWEIPHHSLHVRWFLAHTACDRDNNRADSPLLEVPPNLLERLAVQGAVEARAGGVDTASFRWI